MKNLESELKKALQRKPPPEGFAERVMLRVPHSTARTVLPGWLPVAATLLVAVLGTGSYYYKQHTEAEQAKAELVYALTITSDTLHQTRIKLTKKMRGE